MKNSLYSRLRKKTFAPLSRRKDVAEFIKPSKGSVVEIIVAWRERVIAIQHFQRNGAVSIGADPSCDIALPILKVRKAAIVKFDRGTKLMVPANTRVQVSAGDGAVKILNSDRGPALQLTLEQGELARLEWGDAISVLVRHVPDSPSPQMASVIELSPAEITSAVIALAVFSILRLFTAIYQAPRATGSPQADSPKNALIVIARPTPPPAPAVAAPAIQAPRSPVPAVDGPSILRSASRSKMGSGRRAALRRTRERENLLQNLAGMRGSSASHGVQDLVANANKASGGAGARGYQNGIQFKDTAGEVPNLDGFAGDVATAGRGGGRGRYGLAGLGRRKETRLSFGDAGSPEVISGSVDRGAIRRVILQNIKTIRACYERELNRSPGLYGKVVLAWEIGEQGRVGAVRIKTNELESRAVADCIVRHLKSWRFPEPPARQTVEVEAFPFLFSN